MTPETVRIAITRADGGLSIMSFVTKGDLNAHGDIFTRDPTTDNVNAEIAKSRIEAVSWRLIDPSEIPTDRTFRNAWTDTGAAIGHDMAKVADLYLERVRREREAGFDMLDAQWMKAVGQKETATADAIEAKRQALRDLPATLQPILSAAAAPGDVLAITWTVDKIVNG